MNHFFVKLRRAFTNPRRLYYYFLIMTSSLWSDKKFIRQMYWARTGQHLNLDNPETFTEKQNWLKLYDHNPLYTILADKYRVKKYVSSKIGEEYIVPCYGFWENIEDIEFEHLPNQFVLKCNHNSGGGLVVCRDKSKLNIEAAKEGLRKGLSDNFYKYSRVWPYKHIRRGVLADMFLDDHTGTELRDYKWLCFDGEPKIMYITNKGKNIYENFYDMDFNSIDISHGYQKLSPNLEKPNGFEKMKELAKELSTGIPFVRIDFFYVDERIYFAEYTFFDWGGMKPLNGEWEKILGEWITLKKKEIKK